MAVPIVISALQTLARGYELRTSTEELVQCMESCVNGQGNLSALKVYMPAVFSGCISLVLEHPAVIFKQSELVVLRLIKRLVSEGLNMTKLIASELKDPHGERSLQKALEIFKEVFACVWTI